MSAIGRGRILRSAVCVLLVSAGVRQPGRHRLGRPGQKRSRQRNLIQELGVALAAAVAGSAHQRTSVRPATAPATASATGRRASRAGSPANPWSSSSGGCQYAAKSTAARRLVIRALPSNGVPGSPAIRTHSLSLLAPLFISPVRTACTAPAQILGTRRPGSVSRSSSRSTHSVLPRGPASSASAVSPCSPGTASSAEDTRPP